MVNLARTGFASHHNPRRKEFQNEQLKQSGESLTSSALVSLQKPGNIEVLESGLMVVETKLGWMVFGKRSCRIDNILPSFSMHSMLLPTNNLWELEGTNLTELIPDIVDRLRMYPIGLSADIEKAFLILSIAPEDNFFDFSSLVMMN
ncbi:uncharacterized protein NPIL_181531 [Nephila pilipes]|uniref:Uncharacterized protein n=1 Tax=Nephila pilipes TaxID=299642 RepID=A0A8X6TXV1_NEPPI|nr:uncharacterized protein NPIL_181531 [Nephila pilipes]